MGDYKTNNSSIKFIIARFSAASCINNYLTYFHVTCFEHYVTSQIYVF